MKGLFSWVGFNQTPFEYERQERFAGKTKYPLSKMLKLAKDGIIGFSKKPLQVMGVIGLFSIFISFVVLVSIFLFCFSLYRRKEIRSGLTFLKKSFDFTNNIREIP